jgi:hypothetical protein
MHISLAIVHLRGVFYFEQHRDKRFTNYTVEAQEITNKLTVEPQFKTAHRRNRIKLCV